MHQLESVALMRILLSSQLSPGRYFITLERTIACVIYSSAPQGLMMEYTSAILKTGIVSTIRNAEFRVCSEGRSRKMMLGSVP